MCHLVSGHRACRVAEELIMIVFSKLEAYHFLFCPRISFVLVKIIQRVSQISLQLLVVVRLVCPERPVGGV